jgi:hypothetical protein
MAMTESLGSVLPEVVGDEFVDPELQEYRTVDKMRTAIKIFFINDKVLIEQFGPDAFRKVILNICVIPESRYLTVKP